MSDTMHRAVFTIACLRSRLPVPAQQAVGFMMLLIKMH